MNVYKIDTGSLKLDGGAMFGVVPKTMWEKWHVADANNQIEICMRSLLIVEGQKKILIDNGLGVKIDDKFKQFYHPLNEQFLLQNLKNIGINPNEITDVILTHLHFDHCGGSTVLNEYNEYVPTFPNAIYHVGKKQWEWANNPAPMDRASYIKNNFVPLKNQLNLIEHNTDLFPFLQLRLFGGHTPGQLVPFIQFKNRALVYIADVIPIMAHVPLPYICAYDLAPLVSYKEKDEVLKEALHNNYTLFFEHDVLNECCDLKPTDKGIRVNKSFSLQDWLG
jgi:glyoxylase-like metal-dependent hydrolase (beta-lactamase superfamily II)